MHHHCAEHWVVLTGTAKVMNRAVTFFMAETGSVYILIGQLCVLENPGVSRLEVLEVKSASYLGDGDIVRFEDKYGRC